MDTERDTVQERATEVVVIRLTPRDRERLRRIAQFKELAEAMAIRLWLRDEEARLPKQAA